MKKPEPGHHWTTPFDSEPGCPSPLLQSGSSFWSAADGDLRLLISRAMAVSISASVAEPQWPLPPRLKVKTRAADPGRFEETDAEWLEMTEMRLLERRAVGLNAQKHHLDASLRHPPPDKPVVGICRVMVDAV